MNLRTIERSKARHEGTPTRTGPERGTTGQIKGPAEPIRPGFRWRVGRPARPAAARTLRQRVRLPAVDFTPRRPGAVARLAGAVASRVRSMFRRAVAP